MLPPKLEANRAERLPLAAPAQRRLAYLVSAFPALTETFVLYELLALKQQGIEVTLHALQRGRDRQMHPEAAALLPQVKFQNTFTWRVLAAQFYFLRRAPRAYFAALGTWLRATWGSLRYFAGAVVFFPKTVYFAHAMQHAGITHLHAHFASHPAAAAWVIHRLTGIPYSFTAHGSDLHREWRMLREKVDEAALVVTISDFNRRWILERCGPECGDKVVVVPSGVDTTLFTPHARLLGNAARTEGVSILCIGKLHEVKGQTHLLDACAQLRQRGVAFTCHLVGDGPDRAALLRQAQQLQLDGSVRFHGMLPRREVAALLGEADLLAAPSVVSRDGRREGLPVVLIEALASGVPVVASRLSGIPELVVDGETGLLVPPGDAAALADALQRLIASPALREQLAEAGRAKVVRQFDLQRNAAQLADHFAAGIQP